MSRLATRTAGGVLDSVVEYNLLDLPWATVGRSRAPRDQRPAGLPASPSPCRSRLGSGPFS